MRQADIGGIEAVISYPGTPGPWPGVVVLHEAAGLNRDMRRVTAHLGSRGYAAVAPDLFSGGCRPLCIARTVRDALDPARRGTTDRIERVRRWLAEQDQVAADRIGVVGFCMGGGFAVVAAARSPFAAAAVNYGRVPKDTSLLEGSCPVVANFGADDRIVPRGTAERYQAALSAIGAPVDVEVFPGVGHSFMNHEPAILAPVGIRFDGPTAERAWQRIESFFAGHLAAS